MENQLQIFVNENFGTIRSTIINDEPYFVGKDIATSLNYKDTSDALKRHVDEEDKLTRCFTDTGQSRKMVVINESGLYSLIFGSKLKSAKEFKRWVTSEVLPQIRMTGGYIPTYEDEPNEVFLARAVKIANETIEKKDEIIALQKRRISSLEETEKDWKLLMDTKGTFSINEIAHFVGIGEYKLFQRLREIGVLFKNENNDNVPYEKPIHKGKFISCPAISPDGNAHLQTRVYPEGIPYITKLLRKYGYLEVA